MNLEFLDIQESLDHLELLNYLDHLELLENLESQAFYPGLDKTKTAWKDHFVFPSGSYRAAATYSPTIRQYHRRGRA